MVDRSNCSPDPSSVHRRWTDWGGTRIACTDVLRYIITSRLDPAAMNIISPPMMDRQFTFQRNRTQAFTGALAYGRRSRKMMMTKMNAPSSRGGTSSVGPSVADDKLIPCSSASIGDCHWLAGRLREGSPEPSRAEHPAASSPRFGSEIFQVSFVCVVSRVC